MSQKRSYDRSPQQLRPIKAERHVLKHAAGSCFIEYGDTRVLCAATIQEHVPSWLKNSGSGWITAEYAMLPAATANRTKREIQGQKGRTQEIQRLIGRSLRTVCDLRHLPDTTVVIDCDVLQADGGTRTASVTGAWIALHDALMQWVEAGKIARTPLREQLVAVSVGLVGGELLLDLDYAEDSRAEIDMNIVMTGAGEYVEVQGTGEQLSFSRNRLTQLLDLADLGLQELLAFQQELVQW